MKVDEAIAVYSSYSDAEKSDFLAQLSRELTIYVRDCYEVGSDRFTDPKRVRLLNEVQHRISNQLVGLLRKSKGQYPDEVLVRIILEHPQDEALARSLANEFARLAAQRLTAA
jgi:hypothetical protein